MSLTIFKDDELKIYQDMSNDELCENYLASLKLPDTKENRKDRRAIAYVCLLGGVSIGELLDNRGSFRRFRERL